jgi:hypothetical protein
MSIRLNVLGLIILSQIVRERPIVAINQARAVQAIRKSLVYNLPLKQNKLIVYNIYPEFRLRDRREATASNYKHFRLFMDSRDLLEQAL